MKLEIDKKLAIFRCCITSMGLEQYERSSNAVLRELGIEFADIREFNCCGYPLRNIQLQGLSQGVREEPRPRRKAGKRHSDLLRLLLRQFEIRRPRNEGKRGGTRRDQLRTRQGGPDPWGDRQDTAFPGGLERFRGCGEYKEEGQEKLERSQGRRALRVPPAAAKKDRGIRRRFPARALRYARGSDRGRKRFVGRKIRVLRFTSSRCKR